MFGWLLRMGLNVAVGRPRDVRSHLDPGVVSNMVDVFG
jgi:hypothetical protein